MSGRAQNIVEKIAERFAVGLRPGQRVLAGDYLAVSPDHVMSHDNSGAIIPKFRAIGASRVARPRQPVIGLDHRIQDRGPENLAKYARIEAFAREMGIDFYPAGRGIVHQVICEEGYVLPGRMVVASDSHSNTYGGLGCLGTPIVRTDAAAVWATGRTWWQVPPVARVTLTGRLRAGVAAKDIIVTLCGFFNRDDVLNHALVFAGDGIASLSVEERFTIANMTTEWGALAAVFPADRRTFDWLRDRARAIGRRGLAGVPSDADSEAGEHPRLHPRAIDALEKEQVADDPGAFYAKELFLDLATVSPHVSGPDHVKRMKPVRDMLGVRIDKAYLVSCVNSRTEDLAAAAAVMKGKKVAEGVAFYLAAASSEVEGTARERGDWQALLDAGARVLPSGCGPCIGLGAGLLEDGEVGISATNRNFKGRMGVRSSHTYLASPAVVAASAVAGHIAAPFDVPTVEISGRVELHGEPDGADGPVDRIDGFPRTVEGPVVFCHLDNLNTDGIYAARHTYVDHLTPADQAAAVMENYDPEFRSIAREGDILVGGFNFGTGSSREQAATGLKHFGIRLVVAGSFSQNYRRNAINNGFLAIACPDLARDLKARWGEEALTRRTGERAEIRFDRGEIAFGGRVYRFARVGTAAQELIVAGGLEHWVKRQLGAAP